MVIVLLYLISVIGLGILENADHSFNCASCSRVPELLAAFSCTVLRTPIPPGHVRRIEMRSLNRSSLRNSEPVLSCSYGRIEGGSGPPATQEKFSLDEYRSVD